MYHARLKDVPFFTGVSQQELGAVAQQTDEIDVPAGKVLAREGDFGQEFFVIDSGTAEVTRGGARSRSLGPVTSSARWRCSTRTAAQRPSRPRRPCPYRS
jgi:hypothetical protein